MRRIFSNMVLALATLCGSLLVCELGLRLFYPKYAYFVEGLITSATGERAIPVRIPGYRTLIRHPDTAELHSVHYNNLALRQQRDFTAADLRSAMNIGFFGDSMTENIFMQVQFSFTEPLDFLLNLRNPNHSFNVLNFGVSGYGLSESLIRYENRSGPKLHHVFYMYNANDLYSDARRNIFYLDDTGSLSYGEVMHYGKRPVISKLHLSYLVLEAFDHLHAHLAEIAMMPRSSVFYGYSDLDDRPYNLFEALLRRFKEAAERNGASFNVVWPVNEPPHFPRLAAIARRVGVETYNLRACFGERDPAHLDTPWHESPYRFKNDMHWNEAANRMAAICLHRFTEGLLLLPSLSAETVETALNRYYSAFDQSAGDAWSPQTQSIRSKYDVLGQVGPLPHSPPPTPKADKLTRSTFDVYPEDGWIIYHNEDCKSADFDPASFFLHVVPADLRDLPPHRLVSGFDNLDFRWYGPGQGCTIRRKLPNYTIELVSTGQFGGSLHGDDRLWEVVFDAKGR